MGISSNILQYLSNPVLAVGAQPQGAPGQTSGVMGLEEQLKRALSQGYNPTEDSKSYSDSLAKKALLDVTTAHEQRVAQLNSVMARIQALSQGMQANPYPQHEPLASQGPYPQFQAPEVPQRGPAQVDPSSRFLAGIAAAFAPGQFRGDILASPLHGALEHANQTYQDRLQGYQMRYQQAAQQHEDELNARNEEAKRQAYNAEAAFGSKLGAYNAQHDYLNQVTGPLAQAGSELKSENAPGSAEAAATAGAKATGTLEKIRAQEAASRERQQLTERIFSPLAQMSNRQNQIEATAERDKQKTIDQAARDARLAGYKQKLESELMLPAAQKRAETMAAASKFGATTRAGATVEAAGIRANAPSKSQSGELKSAMVEADRALARKRKFEQIHPADERMDPHGGEHGEALRSMWKDLDEDVKQKDAAVAAARAATPQPSNPIGSGAKEPPRPGNISSSYKFLWKGAHGPGWYKPGTF